MLDYLILLWDDLNDYCGRQQKSAMWFCYVEWSKARLLADLKQKKNDRIRSANGQRHVSGSLINNFSQN